MMHPGGQNPMMLMSFLVLVVFIKTVFLSRLILWLILLT
jgi:hypothetical protein